MKRWILWMALAQAGDLVTTGVGLHQGCVETAPGYRGSPRIGMAVKGGSTIGAAFTLPLMSLTRPRLSKGLAAVIALSGTAAAVWNTSQITKGCVR